MKTKFYLVDQGATCTIRTLGMPKILVVEDEKLITEFVEFLLRQEGFTTVAAPDGDVAVPFARREQPDLVLLDVLMPSMDGFEVLRQLKAAPDLQDIPVIMFTARNRDADLTLAFEMGAADYVVKPFSPPELMARVHKALRQAGRVSPRSDSPQLR